MYFFSLLFHVTVIKTLRWFWFFYNFIFIILLYLTFVFYNTEDGYMAGRNTLEFIVCIK